MRNYNLNAEKAKSAMARGRIQAAGAYVGKFIHAKAITSQKGTEGVEFAFLSDSNENADRLAVWTHNAEGEEIMGLGMLNAVMVVCKAREIVPQKARIKEWDNDAGAKIEKEAIVYPALMGKPIGVLIQMEEYESGGTLKEKPILWGVYDPETNRTPAEILAKASTAKDLDAAIDRLHKMPVKRMKGARPVAVSSSAPADPFGNMDDDISF